MVKPKPKHISPFRLIGLLALVALFGVLVGFLLTEDGDSPISRLPGMPASRLDVAKGAAEHASGVYGVDQDLILAVMWKESRYNPKAEGKAGEIGLMQLMPGTAGEWATKTGQRDFKTSMLFHPVVNAEAGTWYIRRGMELWSHKADPLPYALARYNAGQSRVLKWEKGTRSAGEFIENIGIESTKHYVRDVLDRYGKNIAERIARDQ